MINKFVISILYTFYLFSNSFAIDIIPSNKDALNKFISTDTYHYHYLKYKETNRFLDNFFQDMDKDEVLEALISISNKTSNLSTNKLFSRVLYSNSFLHNDYLEELMEIRLKSIFKYKNYEEFNLIIKFVDKDKYKSQIFDLLISHSKIPQLCSIYRNEINNENLFTNEIDYFHIKLICTVFNKNTSYAIELTKSFRNLKDEEKKNYIDSINGIVTKNNANVTSLVIVNLLNHPIDDFLINIDDLSLSSLLYLSKLSKKVSFNDIINISNILYINKIITNKQLNKIYLIALYKLNPKNTTNKPFIMYAKSHKSVLKLNKFINNINSLNSPQEKLIYITLNKEKIKKLKPVKTRHAKFIVQILNHFNIKAIDWIKINDLWFYKTITLKINNDNKNFINWVENFIKNDTVEKDFYKLAFLIQLGYQFNEKLHISKAKIRKHEHLKSKLEEKTSKFKGPNSIIMKSENFSKQFNKDKFIITKISSLIKNKIKNFENTTLSKNVSQIHKNLHTDESKIISIPKDKIINATGLLIASKNSFLAKNILISNDFISSIEDKNTIQKIIDKTERENDINE